MRLRLGHLGSPWEAPGCCRPQMANRGRRRTGLCPAAVQSQTLVCRPFGATSPSPPPSTPGSGSGCSAPRAGGVPSAGLHCGDCWEDHAVQGSCGHRSSGGGGGAGAAAGKALEQGD